MEAELLERIGPTREAVGTSGATMFSMRQMPILSQGASFDAVATAENLWLSIKVYSSGGENALHIHTREDKSPHATARQDSPLSQRNTREDSSQRNSKT